MTTLDKIRDEIEESITDYILDEEDTNMAIRIGNVMTKVFDIIDNYVEQEPKTGHWIDIDEEPHEVWECDHCGFVIDGSGCIDPYDYRDTYKYCPNCGAKMVEPKESEDKE